jgi:hypothetical protein
MRRNRLTTLLLSSAALLAAGAAGAQTPPESTLLKGAFETVDKKNPLVSADTRVMPLGENLVPTPNKVVVRGICESGSDRVRLRFEAGLIDKSRITDEKAQLDQKHKKNPAQVFGDLSGTCDGTIDTTAGDACFDDDDCDSATPPGDGVCEMDLCTAPVQNVGDACVTDSQCDSQGNCAALPPGVPLLCDKATVSSKVKTGKDGKFKGNASHCGPVEQSLVDAIETVCAGDKTIKVKVRGNEVKSIKISGNGPTAEVSP